MKVSSSNDARLHCELSPRAGAPALMLLNALGTSLEMWDHQADMLRERFELVRYDARGHGRSSIGSASESSLNELAGDALAVLDACGIARAHLCGISLGGMTAMYIARHWPDRVLSIALCSTSTFLPPKENWDARIRLVRAEGMAAVAEPALERWFTPEFRSTQPDEVDRVRQMLLNTNPEGYAACSAAVRDMDLREEIAGIQARTLVIAGTKDPGTPPAHAQFIADRITGARLVTLDAAHLSNIERANEFNATLREFFAV